MGFVSDNTMLDRYACQYALNATTNTLGMYLFLWYIEWQHIFYGSKMPVKNIAIVSTIYQLTHNVLSIKDFQEY